MSRDKNSVGSRIGAAIGGYAHTFFLIFLVLKLTGNIDWSWWLVFSPILVALGVIVLAMLVIATGVLVQDQKK